MGSKIRYGKKEKTRKRKGIQGRKNYNGGARGNWEREKQKKRGREEELGFSKLHTLQCMKVSYSTCILLCVTHHARFDSVRCCLYNLLAPAFKIGAEKKKKNQYTSLIKPFASGNASCVTEIFLSTTFGLPMKGKKHVQCASLRH